MTAGLVVLAGWAGMELARVVRGRPEPAAAVPENGGLSVAAEHLDFGEVWQDSQFKWVLPIRNETEQDIHIAGFANSCACSQVEPRSLTVPAGGEVQVRVTIDLTAKKPSEAALGVRPFDVVIRPVVGSAEGRPWPGWRLRGVVRMALRVEPALVDFGHPSEMATPLTTKTVRVTATTPIDGLEARSDHSAFAVRLKELSGPTMQELLVTPKPSISPGAYTAKVSLVPRLKSGARLPAQEVAVVMRVQPDIQPSPPAMVFGARRVGEVAKETISLQSLTGRAFEVVGVSARGDGLTVKAAEADGFEVRQQVTKAGDQAGEVRFQVRTADRKEQQVVVEVAYRGVE